MATTIKGNLIMSKDMVYKGDLIVKGNILGKNGIRYDLKVNGNINAKDITTRIITARNLDARDITAVSIDAEDISAWNITAWDISARNITYFAVCFAYYNIKCKSIIGTSNNAKHFVLDGKIEVVE